ncbi:MAG TPA: AMP-binding protein [Thermoleophilaceae bacterium]
MSVSSTRSAVRRSPAPELDMPDRSVHGLVLERARSRRDDPAIVDAATGRGLSYGELAMASGWVASGLARRGFGRGDVLALHSPNCPEWPATFLGALWAGGTVACTNPLYKTDELAHLLELSSADLMMTTPQFREGARDAGARDPIVFSELLSAEPAPGEAEVDPAADVAALLYSSGTSGLPKAVELTHRNVVANMLQMAWGVPLGPGDRMLAVAPFFHSMGLSAILLNALYQGATVVSVPRFEVESFLAALQDHRITHTIVPPSVALLLSGLPLVDEYDLSALRVLGVGSAPVSAELEIECEQRLDCLVGQGYGLTEATAVVAIQPMGQPERVRHGAVGMLAPGNEMQVVDPVSAEPLAPGEAGEIWLRGPCVMRGYRGNPKATAEALAEGGWLRTGDLGSIDDDGFVYVHDRLKELIKCKGYQVAPAELEGVLATHPAVAEAAVIGIPDAAAGEVPKAFVAARAPIEAGELMAFVAERVAPYKRIREVEFLDAIPKNPTGKILRRVLRERG